METFFSWATQQTKKKLTKIYKTYFIIIHNFTFPSLPAVAIISEFSDEISKSLIAK